MSESIFKEEAVHAYPDGWTCVHCGDEYSENTTDVEDFYVINTEEGTLCLKCFELENSTLSCSNCGSLLIGEQPAIELPYCAECPDKDKIQDELDRKGAYKIGTKVTVDGEEGEINFVHHSGDHPKYPHNYKITDLSAKGKYKSQKRLEGGNFISHNRIKEG